jgi:AcrR family transcriptional regulator
VKTREKILATALTLFNAHGTDAVTVRHIAAEMGISHGNLCYHFPSTDTIIAALYQQLVAELNAQIQAPAPEAAFSLQTAVAMSHHSMACLQRYRFLMLDFVRIMRRMPEIRAHFRALMGLRKGQFRAMFAALQAQGQLLPEPLPGQYDRLIEHMSMLGDFWISSAEILYTGPAERELAHYEGLLGSLIVPYLTPAGLAAYKAAAEIR